MNASKVVDFVTNNLASALRLGRGHRRTSFRGEPRRPERFLELYSYEQCPMCRRVRERLTELDLDYIHRSCPRGDSPNRRRLVELGGKMQVPFLVDPNVDTMLYESSDIIEYLDRIYGTSP